MRMNFKTAAIAAFMIAMPLLATSPSAAYDGQIYQVCGLNPYGDNFLSLRTCGSTRCAEIMRLGPGTILRSWEPWGTRGWRQVDVIPNPDAPHGGGYPSGWVYEKYICEIRY